jgi:hypothetical protein
MAYNETVWKARQGAGLNKFTETERSGNTVVLTNTPDSITEPGTAFSAENMNHIERGIFEAHEANKTLQTAIAGEAQIRSTADQNLQAAINGKAASSHSHGIGDISNLQNTLNGKAASGHSHGIGDVSGLQDALR